MIILLLRVLICVLLVPLTSAFLARTCRNGNFPTLKPSYSVKYVLRPSAIDTSCHLLTARKQDDDDDDRDDGEEKDDDNRTNKDGDDDDDIEIDLSGQDWRAFRAKLVLSEPTDRDTSAAAATASDGTDSSTILSLNASDGDLDGIGAIFSDEIESTRQLNQMMTPLDPSQWAYDSGQVIEQGAVILGGVEQTYGFGLRQQYFHKAVILVLDHDESTFTKGIILNRPTDLTFPDDVNPGTKWRVWFGGDVQGLNSWNPDIVCLHSLRNDQAMQASIPIMKDIQWTTFENAKRLVKVGAAQPSDFWVFCGYAGWGPGQLRGELDRKSWYMVATDSQTLLKELARQSSTADPRDAGLDTWTLLMSMIGRGPTALECTGGFDDLMLKEWALMNLLSTSGGGLAGESIRSPQGIALPTSKVPKGLFSIGFSSSSGWTNNAAIMEGMLLRAAPVDRSPFLLDNQEMHKSLVLVLSDDERLTIGVLLNRPAAKGLDIQITKNGSGGQKRKISLPLRFGGTYAVKGSEPLLWLHCHPVLRAAKVGTPVGAVHNKQHGIWKCTAADVTMAVGQGLAVPEQFLVVSGVCMWTKTDGGRSGGIQEEVRSGRFEPVPEAQTQVVWDTLSKQEVLTSTNILQNLAIGSEAWSKAAPPSATAGVEKLSIGKIGLNLFGGLGKGHSNATANHDGNSNSYVFKSEVKVSQLSDDALLSWVATFLLGAPTLGG